MDKGSFFGVFLAVAGILAGLLIEGGNIGQILQPTAALIVFGGTMGAVLLQFPLRTVALAFKRLGHAFAPPRKQHDHLIQMLVSFANKARRNGVVSLDSMTECEERLPAVFEAAGGFSPTIGILGAVLGLIQVMHHLDNMQEVGRGIAVAFVATVYGVGIANLFFLPLAGKLRLRMRADYMEREMMLEGVASILDGMNPRMLEVKLGGFIEEQSRGKEQMERAA
jgi:chemotaxis protein MotA